MDWYTVVTTNWTTAEPARAFTLAGRTSRMWRRQPTTDRGRVSTPTQSSVRQFYRNISRIVNCSELTGGCLLPSSSAMFSSRTVLASEM